MNTRQRFHSVLEFRSFDRLPIFEWATWWNLTIERWNGEGMPLEKGGNNVEERREANAEIMRYFDLDIHYQDWLAMSTAQTEINGKVENREDYRNLRENLFPENNVDFRMWEKWARKQEEGKAVLWFTLDGFFWFPRRLLGIEKHLYSFYDQPELYHEICEELSDCHLRIIEDICSVCTPDFMTFAEDMSYNNGPMISEELFNEFMKPYYKKVIPALKKKGIKIFVDTDGDVGPLAKWMENAGLEGILPLERLAGTDLVEMRKKHPEQLYIGGFDKGTMSRGENAMRKEFERLLPVASKGGYIISCDHQTPPEVSLENYRIYLKLFREYAELAAGEFDRSMKPENI